MFRNLFQKNNQIKGIIGFLGLQDFWNNCTADEQNALIRYHQGGLGIDRNSSPIVGDISFSSSNVFKYFSAMIGWATSEKNYILADKMITYANQLEATEPVLLDAHFFWISAFECYYKQRDSREDALNLCEKFCLVDINMFPSYRNEFVSKIGMNADSPAFRRLIVLYEKQGNIKKAIDICKLAIEYNLVDSTKGGYEGRLQKLQKKLK